MGGLIARLAGVLVGAGKRAGSKAASLGKMFGQRDEKGGSKAASPGKMFGQRDEKGGGLVQRLLSSAAAHAPKPLRGAAQTIAGLVAPAGNTRDSKKGGDDEQTAKAEAKQKTDYANLLGQMGRNPNALADWWQDDVTHAQKEAGDAKADVQAKEDARKKQEQLDLETANLSKKFAFLGKGAGLVYAAFLTLPQAIKAWTGHLVESRRELSQWNSTIAGAMAQLDAARIQREVRTAASTQASTQSLIKGQDELERALQPVRERLTTLVNVAGIVAQNTARAATWLGAMLPEARMAAFLLDQIENLMKDNGPADAPIFDWRDALHNAPRRANPRNDVQPLQ